MIHGSILDDNDHLALWASVDHLFLIRPFMLWHKWSRRTTCDNISGPVGPIMSKINGPPGLIMPGLFML